MRFQPAKALLHTRERVSERRQLRERLGFALERIRLERVNLRLQFLNPGYHLSTGHASPSREERRHTGLHGKDKAVQPRIVRGESAPYDARPEAGRRRATRRG